MNAAASSLAGSDSSNAAVNTTPSAAAPASLITAEFSQASPPAITAVMPSSRVCRMKSGAAVRELGAKMMSGFALADWSK